MLLQDIQERCSFLPGLSCLLHIYRRSKSVWVPCKTQNVSWKLTDSPAAVCVKMSWAKGRKTTAKLNFSQAAESHISPVVNGVLENELFYLWGIIIIGKMYFYSVLTEQMFCSVCFPSFNWGEITCYLKAMVITKSQQSNIPFFS